MSHQFALKIFYIFVLYGMVHASATNDGCTQICPDIYAPVCDVNGNLYDNQCGLENALCKNPGLPMPPIYRPYYPCKKDDKVECCLPKVPDGTNDGCTKLCPAFYAPICDVNGNLYDNQCELENALCKNPGLPVPLIYRPYYPCVKDDEVECCLPKEPRTLL